MGQGGAGIYHALKYFYLVRGQFMGCGIKGYTT